MIENPIAVKCVASSVGANMAKKQTESIQVTTEQVESLVHVIRGQRVITDFDLARLYGVTTMALNQAVRRNVERFRARFCVSAYAARVYGFDITNCDIKAGSWRPAKATVGLHRTWRGDAFQRTPVADGRAS